MCKKNLHMSQKSSNFAAETYKIDSFKLDKDMKKLFILCIAVLASMSMSAKQPEATKDLKLIEGNVQFINENAKVALHMDFENAISVEYGKDNKTVERNEGRMLDSIPAAEWAKDFKELNERMVAYFNEAAEKAGKPIRMTANADEANYDIFIQVDTIDMGNSGAAVFVRHAGCAIGTGDVWIKKHNTGDVVCHLYMNKMMAEWNDMYKIDRLIRLYGWDLMGKYFFNGTMYPVPFSTKFKITIGKDGKDALNYKYLYPNR